MRIGGRFSKTIYWRNNRSERGKEPGYGNSSCESVGNVVGSWITFSLSAQAGADCVHVHDVKVTKELLDMYYGIFPL